jgi:hypothetical protein
MQIKSSVLFPKETCTVVIPALHCMYGNTGEHDSGTSGHESVNERPARPLTENVVCP